MQDWPSTACAISLGSILIVGVGLTFRLIHRGLQRRAEVWSNLARQTGLSFKPMGVFTAPSVSGQYRGRHLSLARVLVPVGESSRTVTQVYVQVNNRAHCSLAIQRRWLFGRSEVSSGNEGFDRRLSVKGSPREFVRRALDIVVGGDPRLLAWVISNRPEIRLKGSSLICSPAERTDVPDQIALFDLLCDLAELSEHIESKDAGPGK